MSRTPGTALFLLLILLGSLHACAPEPPLRIGTNRWPGYEPFYLARTQGWLDSRHIRLVELPSSTEVMQYLRTATLEGGALTLDETLTLCAEGLPMKVLLVLDLSNGGDVLLARPDIGQLSDLRGKRIGVESSAVGAVMLRTALDAAGLQTEEVRLIPLTADRHVEAFMRGEVDAVVTFEPMRTRLLQQGARLLFDSSRVPGLIVDVLAVPAQTLHTHPHALEELTAAYFRARRFMAEHPQQAASLMAPRLELSAREFLQALEGLKLPTLAENRCWLAPPHPHLVQVAERLQTIMKHSGLLSGNCDVQTLAAPDHLPIR